MQQDPHQISSVTGPFRQFYFDNEELKLATGDPASEASKALSSVSPPDKYAIKVGHSAHEPPRWAI